MEEIDIDEFKRLNIRVGKIISAERIKGSTKLLLLKVNIGNEVRQLVAGLALYYKPDELVGREIIVLTNLKPKKIYGHISQGMLLAADVNGKPVLIIPEKEVPPGSIIR